MLNKKQNKNVKSIYRTAIRMTYYYYYYRYDRAFCTILCFRDSILFFCWQCRDVWVL